jgi:hypothetical protein
MNVKIAEPYESRRLDGGVKKWPIKLDGVLI